MSSSRAVVVERFQRDEPPIQSDNAARMYTSFQHASKVKIHDMHPRCVAVALDRLNICDRGIITSTWTSTTEHQARHTDHRHSVKSDKSLTNLPPPRHPCVDCSPTSTGSAIGTDAISRNLCVAFPIHHPGISWSVAQCSVVTAHGSVLVDCTFHPDVFRFYLF